MNFDENILVETTSEMESKFKQPICIPILKKAKSRKQLLHPDSLRNNFPETTPRNAQGMFKKQKKLDISNEVNLENQSDESGITLKEKRTAICEICGFESNPQGLLKHVQMMHEKSFKCLFCESKFAQERQLEYHIEAKHPGTSELKYFCSECGDGFMFERNMIKHSEKHKKTDELVHEREKGHKCSICHKIFSRKFCLQKHIKTVHEIQKESLQKLMKTVPVNLNNFSKNDDCIIKSEPSCWFS